MVTGISEDKRAASRCRSSGFSRWIERVSWVPSRSTTTSTMRAVLREMWPYYLPLVVTLALITFVPMLTTWLPRLAIGN